MDIIDIILRIIGSIFIIGLVLMIILAIRINANTNKYIANVKILLQKVDCPLFSVDQIIDLHREGATPEQAVEYIMKDWTGDTLIK